MSKDTSRTASTLPNLRERLRTEMMGSARCRAVWTAAVAARNGIERFGGVRLIGGSAGDGHQPAIEGRALFVPANRREASPKTARSSAIGVEISSCRIPTGLADLVEPGEVRTAAPKNRQAETVVSDRNVSPFTRAQGCLRAISVPDLESRVTRPTAESPATFEVTTIGALAPSCTASWR